MVVSSHPGPVDADTEADADELASGVIPVAAETPAPDDRPSGVMKAATPAHRAAVVRSVLQSVRTEPESIVPPKLVPPKPEE